MIKYYIVIEFNLQNISFIIDYLMRNSFKPDEDGIKNILTLLVFYEIKKPTKLFTKYLIRTKIQIPLDVC